MTHRMYQKQLTTTQTWQLKRIAKLYYEQSRLYNLIVTTKAGLSLVRTHRLQYHGDRLL